MDSLSSMRFQTTEFCLILLFLFYHLPYVLSQQDRSELCKPYHCGNLTVSFPFWGGDRYDFCGHTSLKLICNKMSNTTSLTISGHNYNVLHIDNRKSNILKLSRKDFSGPFCSASFSSTVLPSDLFQILPSYKSLNVFYACDPRRHFLGNFTCPGKGLGSVIQISKYRKLCDESFRVTVPRSFVPDEETLSLTRLENVLREGFEVKLNIDDKFCQACIAPGGHCGLTCCKRGLGIGCPTTVLSGGSYHYNRFILITFGTVAGSIVTLFMVVFLAFWLWERRRTKALIDQNLETLVTLRWYSYGQIKRITKSFAEVVGQGGFGTVYKGKLCDGRKVAVKVLKDLKQNSKDFINEVASMSQTSQDFGFVGMMSN